MTAEQPTAEAHAFLNAHPDVEAIELLLTDAGGVARGKLIAREELTALYAHGRWAAGSMLGLDLTGEDVEETGLVWSVGDADRLCRPVPGALVPAPWMSRPSGQVLLTMHDADGAPTPFDPRHVLGRAIARAAQIGLRPVMAAEIEFYLLARDAAETLTPAASAIRTAPPARFDAYGLAKLEDMASVFDDIYAAARAQQLPVRTLMSEYAPGQFEITLQHRADALRAMDDAIVYKRLIRGVAARHGLIACFMAKPFTEHAGSGMHLHLSLQDEDGRNVFASEAAEGGEPLRHAVAGLQRTMAESMLVFAPNANSYRRFRRMSYAPTTPNWGVNNRSVSLRIPAGPAQSRHLEHRLSGADANPYLAAAVVLTAALQGLQTHAEPGPPTVGNGYAERSAARLPADWASAIRAAEQSTFLADALGVEFHRAFLAIKRQEYEKFNARVTEVDLEWGL